MEDQEIIGLYHQRNENAITQTEKKHGAFCRRLAIHILSNREDAEECVNDTWMAAWNRMPPDWPQSLRAYLGRITRNISISRFRFKHASKRFAGMELLLSELEECVPGGRPAEEKLEQQALSEIIARWLAGLEEEDRVLFVRRYWYGDTVKSLAFTHGMTANRMARRMQRLRQSLRAVLEEEGVDV